MRKITFLLILLLFIFLTSCYQNSGKILIVRNSNDTIKNQRQPKNTKLINKTYLGSVKRNYYGNEAPDKLNINWTCSLGTGKTVTGKGLVSWSGAGWTGQPLMIKYDDVLYLIQGAYDHHLKKIRASDGKVIAQYKYDDVIKGTGSIWAKYNKQNKLIDYYILQGSRKGLSKNLNSAVVPSYRAVAFSNMKAVWKYNSVKLRSYSRDVDASALILNDTAYIGLENGLFMVFNPDPEYASEKEGIIQPQIYDIDTLFYSSDVKTHGGNLVTEASPSYLNGRVYVSSGSGHLFGYNLKKKKIDWVFDVGADMDGSPVVTDDSCLLITIEKQYIPGEGGVMKLDPSLPPEKSVVWYFPVKNIFYVLWYGGVIGSVGVSDYYNDTTNLCVFTAIDGNMYVVNHEKIDFSRTTYGPNNQNQYPVPELVFKYKTGPSISTPIIVENKIVAATYNGVYLFSYNENMNFKLLDHQNLGSFEATPFVWNRKIYVASRNGLLYCFGD